MLTSSAFLSSSPSSSPSSSSSSAVVTAAVTVTVTAVTAATYYFYFNHHHGNKENTAETQSQTLSASGLREAAAGFFDSLGFPRDLLARASALLRPLLPSGFRTDSRSDAIAARGPEAIPGAENSNSIEASNDPNQQSTGLNGATQLETQRESNRGSDGEGKRKQAEHENEQTDVEAAMPPILFVLGGPGAGKGTQCQRLVKEFGFVHLSAGDLLREETVARAGSPVAQLIEQYMVAGKIVPMEITIGLLKDAMRRCCSASTSTSTSTSSEKTKTTAAPQPRAFLIDGFPRECEQGVAFEHTVARCAAVLYFACPEDILLLRLVGRGATSGRIDDHEDTMRRRLETYRSQTLPVIEKYRAQGKVIEVSAVGSINEVFESLCSALRTHPNCQGMIVEQQ